MTWTTGDTLAVLVSLPAAMELSCLAICLLRPFLEGKTGIERLDRALRASVLSGLIAAPALAVLIRWALGGMGVPNPAAGPLCAVLGAVWLAGALYLGVFRHLGEERLLRRVERMSRRCGDRELVDLKEGMAAWLDVKGRVPVYTGDLIPTMYTRGILRKKIFISNADCTKDEWKLLLTHELIHCRRNDCLYRRALLLLRAVFWFCPHVGHLTDYAIEVNEMACDEKVIRERPRGARRAYCRLLVRMREDMSGLLGAFLGGGEDILEKRLLRLVRPHPESPALSLLLSAGVTLLIPAVTVLMSAAISQCF